MIDDKYSGQTIRFSAFTTVHVDETINIPSCSSFPCNCTLSRSWDPKWGITWNGMDSTCCTFPTTVVPCSDRVYTDILNTEPIQVGGFEYYLTILGFSSTCGSTIVQSDTAEFISQEREDNMRYMIGSLAVKCITNQNCPPVAANQTQCTTSYCDQESGKCLWNVRSGSCDDFNPCSSNDVCITNSSTLLKPSLLLPHWL